MPLEVVNIGFGGHAATVFVGGVLARTIDINPEDGLQRNQSATKARTVIPRAGACFTGRTVPCAA